MTKKTLAGLMVVAVAIIATAPSANGLVLNISNCMTWTGAATGNAPPGTCAQADPLAVKLTVGNPGCFGAEPRGDSTISSTKVSTGPLSFSYKIQTTDLVNWDWFFVKVNGVEVLRFNPNTRLFVCNTFTGTRSIMVPAGLNTITFGAHQDGFGDLFGAEITGISV